MLFFKFDILDFMIIYKISLSIYIFFVYILYACECVLLSIYL